MIINTFLWVLIQQKLGLWLEENKQCPDKRSTIRRLLENLFLIRQKESQHEPDLTHSDRIFERRLDLIAALAYKRMILRRNTKSMFLN